MNDMSDVETRLNAALDRIALGLKTLGEGGDTVGAAEVQTLKDALTAEREANEQLGERVRSWKEKHATVVGEFEKQLEEAAAKLKASEAALKALQAERATQISEMDSILLELKPLVGGALNA